MHVYSKLTGNAVGAFDLPRKEVSLLHKKLDSVEGVAACAAAHHTKTRNDTFARLVDDYQSMTCLAYKRLAQATRNHYDVHLKQARAKFIDLPRIALNTPKSRLTFEAWRDEAEDRPAFADMRMIVLNQVLNNAVRNFKIDANHAASIERIYQGKDKVRAWTKDEIAQLKAAAPPHVAQVIDLALITGARISALLALSPANVKDGWLTYDPQKRGRIVRLPLKEWPILNAAIADLPTDGLRLLNNAHGKPWTREAWKSAFRRTRAEAKLAEIRFHDFRVTAITIWARTIKTDQIALLTGHSLAHVDKILDRHYVERSDENVIIAVKKVVRAARK